MNLYLIIGLTTLVASLVLTPCAMQLAHAAGWVDRPGLRKIHGKPVAYLGGAAMFGALCVGLIALMLVTRHPTDSLSHLDPRMLSLLGGATLLFVVGLVDDIRNVRPRIKLLAQIIAATAVCASGITINHITITDSFAIEFGQLSFLVTVFWIVGVTNAVNLIDGMDGLAAGLSAVACAAIGWIAYQAGLYTAAILMVALLGSVLGYLPYNLNPAKIFMGDSGSLVLGFLLASTSVLCAAKTATFVGIGVPLVALGIPIFDTLFAMVRRTLEGRSLFSADRNHIHHRLLALGFGQTRIVGLLCAETALAVGLVLSFSSAPRFVLGAIVVTGLLIHVTLFRSVGAIRFRDSFSGLSRIAAAKSEAKEEQMNLDDLELQFREARSIFEWWDAVASTGAQLGFAKLQLTLASRDGDPIKLAWSRGPEANVDGLVQMRVPVRHRRAGQPLSILVEAPAEGSLENAGRHVAQFCRMLDRHSVADLPVGARRRRPVAVHGLQAI